MAAAAKKKGAKKPKRTAVTVDLDIEPPSKEAFESARGRDRTRMEAMLLYVTTLENINILSLHKDPRFKPIPIQTFHRWAKDDGWVAKRKGFFGQLYQGLEKRLASTLTQSLYQEVQQLMKIRDLAMTKLTEKDEETGELVLRAKSWEGVAKTLMESNKRLDEIRRMVAIDFLPAGAEAAAKTPEEDSPEAVIHQYNDEDIQHATKAVLARRRAAIRAKAGVGDEAESEAVDENEGS